MAGLVFPFEEKLPDRTLVEIAAECSYGPKARGYCVVFQDRGKQSALAIHSLHTYQHSAHSNDYSIPMIYNVLPFTTGG